MKDQLGFDLPPPARIGRSRGVLIAVVVVVLLGGAFVAGWLPKRRAREALAADVKAAEGAKLRVDVMTPKVVSSDRALVLPGSVQPLEETVLYPRASGYVRAWSADIGDKVKEGAELAVIDTPELDQQIAQARAELVQAEAGLVQAEANAAFSRTNVERYEKLTPAGLASQQELEKARAQAKVDEASVTVARANVAAQRANIDRLAQLKSFARVTAPFAGTITARSIERGALVTAGNATPLFKIAATETVRVFVEVPQDVAPSVKQGAAAPISVREYPGRTFEGKIARAAGALDAQTRTMTTEVRVPNASGELLAGMYAQVSLALAAPHRVFEVPSTALLTDAKGARLALVTPEDTLRLVPAFVERDTGATLEIASGLNEGDRVVRLASAELVEGRAVEVNR